MTHRPPATFASTSSSSPSMAWACRWKGLGREVLNRAIFGFQSLNSIDEGQHRDSDDIETCQVLLDLPSLAFFTTYALLVLFWAEIYYQARAVSTDGLRPCFYTINGVVYAIQPNDIFKQSDQLLEVFRPTSRTDTLAMSDSG
ncbi:hypothetical protein Dimus_013148 [Dionaea muscipula]